MEDQEIYRANIPVEFDPESHVYRVHGKVIPSVTQIIKELIGYAYYADEWYLQRGRAVHACAALLAKGKQFKFDQQIKGYVEGVRNFLLNVSNIGLPGNQDMVETMVYSERFRYAGTIDLISDNTIYDYKNSLDFERLRLQLGGYYQACIDSGVEVNKIGFGVILDGKGGYKLTQKINLTDAAREFLALRAVYGIKERLHILEGK